METVGEKIGHQSGAPPRPTSCGYVDGNLCRADPSHGRLS